MQEKSLFKFPYHPIYTPLLVGIGIGSIHFVITYYLFDSPSCSSEVIGSLLWAPGFILNVSSNYFYQVLVSSLLYGIGGGLLVSKDKKIQILGIVAIILLFLSICNVFIIFMGGSCA